MTTNKKRIYLSVLGAGLCVLLYDVVSGDDLPAQAEASGLHGAGLSQEADGSNPEVVLATLVVAPFPRSLPEAMLLAKTRDIFVPSESVVHGLLGPQDETVEDSGAQTAQPLVPPVPFDESHTLSAIFKVQGSRVAVVDEKMLREGQRFSDCVVGAIGDRGVVFNCTEGDEELRLDRPILGEDSRE